MEALAASFTKKVDIATFFIYIIIYIYKYLTQSPLKKHLFLSFLPPVAHGCSDIRRLCSLQIKKKEPDSRCLRRGGSFRTSSPKIIGVIFSESCDLGKQTSVFEPENNRSVGKNLKPVCVERSVVNKVQLCFINYDTVFKTDPSLLASFLHGFTARPK